MQVPNAGRRSGRGGVRKPPICRSRTLAFLDEVAAGAYRVAPFEAADVEAAAEIVGRYRDQNVGLADASLLVLALRHDTNRLLSLDERQFRVLRPLRRFRSFKLLPLDA